MSNKKNIKAEITENRVVASCPDGEVDMGSDSPSPVDYLLSSLAGCAGLTLRAILKKARVDVESISEDLNATHTTDPFELRKIEVNIKVKAEDLDQNQLKRAIDLMENHCPVHAALCSSVAISYSAEIV